MMPFDADATEAHAAAQGVGLAGQTLETLRRGVDARVLSVNAIGSADAIAERLRELGFVEGEPVRIVAAGPLGGEPLLVQVGFTRFALRKAEAARVSVVPEAAR